MKKKSQYKKYQSKWMKVKYVLYSKFDMIKKNRFKHECYKKRNITT